MSAPHDEFDFAPREERRIPIFKDGKPGWIVGGATTISNGDFCDIEMMDGRMTFVRLPDHGRRITPRIEEVAS